MKIIQKLESWKANAMLVKYFAIMMNNHNTKFKISGFIYKYPWSKNCVIRFKCIFFTKYGKKTFENIDQIF